MSAKEKGNRAGKLQLGDELEYCDICGQTYYESELTEQDGYKKCPTCVDDEQDQPDQEKLWGQTLRS